MEEKDNKFVVTISRKYGSNGRAIGRHLAERLHLNYYDRDLITEAVKRNGMSMDIINEYYASVTKNSYLNKMSLDFEKPFGPDKESIELYMKKFDIIRELANKESCIIIGGCSDYILRNTPNTIKVFLSAPFEIRVERVMNRYALTKEKARELVIKKDKNRSDSYNYFTHQRWGDEENYNIIINTGDINIDDSVEMIIDYINLRM